MWDRSVLPTTIAFEVASQHSQIHALGNALVSLDVGGDDAGRGVGAGARLVIELVQKLPVQGWG